MLVMLDCFNLPRCIISVQGFYLVDNFGKLLGDRLVLTPYPSLYSWCGERFERYSCCFCRFHSGFSRYGSVNNPIQAFPFATFIIANNTICFIISILQLCHKVWQNLRSLSHKLWDNWKKRFFPYLGDTTGT